ncbi:MAG: hypothetical protein AAF590_07590 [Pseudomonadota bacterium]
MHADAHSKADRIREARRVRCERIDGPVSEDCNFLLPMAFPEGSPMHPAYGAGHATVAGGCVTILKAFFEMFDDEDCTTESILRGPDGRPIIYEADVSDGGRTLDSLSLDGGLTIQGELDKLAANISIGRNMAGVHYYSDYFDSIRMGERVAVGILEEQALTYGEDVRMCFTSFDGDLVMIEGNKHKRATLTIKDRDGKCIPIDEWWMRHVPGEEHINRAAICC